MNRRKKIIFSLLLIFLFSISFLVFYKIFIGKDKITMVTKTENKEEDTLESIDKKEPFTVTDQVTAPEKKEEEKKQSEEPKKEEKSELNNTDIKAMDTREKDWYFIFKGEGNLPEPPKEAKSYISNGLAYFTGGGNEKVLYLTFDEGYENGYTSKILEVLKRMNVKATFFVTKPYISSNKTLVQNIVREGHLVANHSDTHPSMALVALTGYEKFSLELINVEKEFKNVTGKEISKFFRPPMGKYSELSLYYAKKLGYKNIFWSFAYGDYDVNKQPEKVYAKNHILKNTHNGAILLLHAISKTNTEILEELITEWRKRGYEFKTLDYIKD